MATVSFKKQSVEVGQIEKKGKEWKCSNEYYAKLGTILGPTISDPPPPPYLSLICVPVIDNLVPNTDPLGVIAFHSHEKTTFDDAQINLLVVRIADRISQAIAFYQFLK